MMREMTTAVKDSAVVGKMDGSLDQSLQVHFYEMVLYWLKKLFYLSRTKFYLYLS